MLCRAFDHLSERAEVLSPNKVQEHMGVEGRGQEICLLGIATSHLFFRGNHINELSQLPLLHHFFKPVHISCLVDSYGFLHVFLGSFRFAG